MDEKTLISSLQQYLASRISVQVSTRGLEDERPVPVVLIDDWDTRDKNIHNSPYAGTSVENIDNDGNLESERYLRFDFRTRVEFLVREADEVDAVSLKDEVKSHIRTLREYPTLLHEDVKEVNLSGGGNPSFTFTEPREAELLVSARFHADHIVTLTPDDTPHEPIEQITDSFAFTP
jgi:hypothetical protein